jgi:hypothetical protein
VEEERNHLFGRERERERQHAEYVQKNIFEVEMNEK